MYWGTSMKKLEKHHFSCAKNLHLPTGALFSNCVNAILKYSIVIMIINGVVCYRVIGKYP